ncbi:hypothetical protein EVAR_27943_1 [Eumeta japonica]|uniref:Uncharacterized protein n=1 Tax=Eumeta variegata TaxID=151549 RepID=A0A4C1UVL0_EUMVA|nr:hypothetical protein EVAR_27943_1 [Eumeta japonica]
MLDEYLYQEISAERACVQRKRKDAHAPDRAALVTALRAIPTPDHVTDTAVRPLRLSPASVHRVQLELCVITEYL